MERFTRRRSLVRRHHERHGRFRVGNRLVVGSADSARSSGLVGIAIVTGLWTIWITVSACSAGAYLAGRMRRPTGDTNDHERHARDEAYGLVI